MDINALNDLLELGFIGRATSASGELSIYHSTEKAEAEWSIGDWPEEALIAQGLILDRECNIIARPIKKFFNWDNFEGVICTDINYKVQKAQSKLVCMLYKDEDRQPTLATRDSLYSEYTKSFRQFHSNEGINGIIDTHTATFEIQVDDNNNYSFCLISINNIVTGKEVSKNDQQYLKALSGCKNLWEGLRCEELPNINLNEIHTMSNNADLNVVYSNGFRIQMNFDQYLGLTRITEKVSIKIIWEYLKNDYSLNVLISSIPKEFHSWIVGVAGDLMANFNILELKIKNEYNEIMNLVSANDNKAFAELAKTKENASMLFCLKNNQNINNLIWDKIKPKYQNPYKSLSYENMLITV